MMERLSRKDKLGYFVPENVMYGDPFLMGEVRGYAIDRLAYYEDLEKQGRLVEVVRCKDCQHRGEPGDCPMCCEELVEWDDDGHHEWDYITHDRTTDDGFCDCGERRDSDVH